MYAAIAAEATDSLEDSKGMQRRRCATSYGLKQICDHPALVLKGSLAAQAAPESSKATEIWSRSWGKRRTALIFTQFAEMGALIQKHLQNTFGKEVQFLSGATPRERRERMVERFQQADGPQLWYSH